MHKSLSFRIICLILSVLFIMSTFTACSDKDKETSFLFTDESAAYTIDWVIKPTITAQLIQPLVCASFNENTNHYDISYAECFKIMVDGKYGLIGTDGEMIIEAEYDDIFAIRDGDDFLAVKKGENGDKQTYIHSDTYRTQSAQKKYNTKKYEYYWNTKSGSPLFVCTENGNTTEKDFAPMLPEAVKGVNKEASSYVPTGKYGLFVNKVNLTGMIYTNAGFYSDGLIAFESNGKWGYLDSTGRTVIPFEYDAVWGYNALGGKDTAYESFDGCITVTKDKKFGVISTEGDILVPFEFDNATPVVEGKAFVKSDGKWGVIKVYDTEAPSSEKEETTSTTTTVTTTTTTTTISEKSTESEPETESTSESTTSQTTTAAAYTNGSYVLSRGDVNLREDIGLDAEILITIPEGKTVYVSEVRNGWGKTVYNTHTGWFNLRYAEKTS
ncbi:MAG: WG repeat-containing protein [Clostridia bacterium]|nr:WG repeat-containing protein [Clostridia bacterium]